MRISKSAAWAAMVVAMGLAGEAAAQSGQGGMGPGTMGGHMMQPGTMGPGMMGPGMMGHGMMGPGMMGPGMMMGNGAWCGGCGYMGPGWGAQRSNLNLSAADVKAYMERYLQYQGNPRVKLGAIKETDVDTVTADVVTTEGGALVQRYIFDRHSGAYRPG